MSQFSQSVLRQLSTRLPKVLALTVAIEDAILIDLDKMPSQMVDELGMEPLAVQPVARERSRTRTQQNAERSRTRTQQNPERSRTQDPRTQQNAGIQNAERRILSSARTQQNPERSRTQGPRTQPERRVSSGRTQLNAERSRTQRPRTQPERR